MNFREYLKESQLNERLVWVDLNDSYDHKYKDDTSGTEFVVKYADGNSKEKTFAYALTKKLMDGKKLPPTWSPYDSAPIDYKTGKSQTITFVSKGKNGRAGSNMNVTFEVLKNGTHEWNVTQTS